MFFKDIEIINNLQIIFCKFNRFERQKLDT